MTQTTFTIAASGDDSRLRRTGATYPPTGGVAVLATGTDLDVWKEWSGSQFDCRLQFLRFDTSAISDDQTITNVVLRIVTGVSANVDSRNLNIEWYQGTTWASEAVIDTDDWTDDVGTTAGAVSLDTASAASVAIDFTLSNGEANINKTGFTGIRLGISGVEPVGANEYWGKSWDHATFAPPDLVVDYSPASIQIQSTVSALRW